MEKEAMRENDEVPPGKRKKKVKIGIVCNLKKGDCKDTDEEAEYDSIETVNAIKAALESKNIEVTVLEADNTLISNLTKKPIDIAFNIAEGKGGRSREAQAPIILDMMGVPYSGSDAATLCLALDKEWCKRFLSCYDILSPLSMKLDGMDTDFKKLHYPVIVKPNAEGSSKGIHGLNVFNSALELENYMKKLGTSEGLIAEEYIVGREFTVSVCGNGRDTVVYEPLEIVFDKLYGDYNVYNYEVKKDFTKYIHYECPSKLEKSLQNQMKEIAHKIYSHVYCRDFARMDFRVDKDGKIYFIELNPLPGLAPSYSDFPINLEMCGTGYIDAVRGILLAAAKRYKIKVSY